MRCLQQILSIFIVVIIVISCGNDSTGPGSETGATTGTVEITTSTSGSDQDQDGYRVMLGKNEENISSNETISISGLDEGSYNTELSNIAGNCSVDGENPRTITVTAGETASTTFEVNCQEIEPVLEQKAKDAVLEVMRDKGWSFSKLVKSNSSSSTESDGPSGLDYITTDVNESGAREVYLFIGPDGHVIPSTEWQENNQSWCRNRELRYMRVPVKRFNLELFSFTDGFDVFAQYIDIETGEIEAQREGQSTSLVEAISDAWNKIEKPIKKPADPCGEKISNVTLTFEATTSHDLYHKDAGFTETFKEEINATVDLTYNDEDSMYVGSGDLDWANYYYSEGDCELPNSATLKVHKFVYGDPATANEETELQIQFRDMERTSCTSPDIGSFEIYPDFSFSWWLLHKDEIHKKVELDNWATTVEHIYAVHDWEVFESLPDLIGQKKYDHSTTVEDDDATNNISGESTLRIIHESN